MATPRIDRAEPLVATAATARGVDGVAEPAVLLYPGTGTATLAATAVAAGGATTVRGVGVAGDRSAAEAVSEP